MLEEVYVSAPPLALAGPAELQHDAALVAWPHRKASGPPNRKEDSLTTTRAVIPSLLSASTIRRAATSLSLSPSRGVPSLWWAHAAARSSSPPRFTAVSIPVAHRSDAQLVTREESTEFRETDCRYGDVGTAAPQFWYAPLAARRPESPTRWTVSPSSRVEMVDRLQSQLPITMPPTLPRPSRQEPQPQGTSSPLNTNEALLKAESSSRRKSSDRKAEVELRRDAEPSSLWTERDVCGETNAPGPLYWWSASTHREHAPHDELYMGTGSEHRRKDADADGRRGEDRRGEGNPRAALFVSRLVKESSSAGPHTHQDQYPLKPLSQRPSLCCTSCHLHEQQELPHPSLSSSAPRHHGCPPQPLTMEKVLSPLHASPPLSTSASGAGHLFAIPSLQQCLLPHPEDAGIAGGGGSGTRHCNERGGVPRPEEMRTLLRRLQAECAPPSLAELATLEQLEHHSLTRHPQESSTRMSDPKDVTGHSPPPPEEKSKERRWAPIPLSAATKSSTNGLTALPAPSPSIHGGADKQCGGPSVVKPLQEALRDLVLHPQELVRVYPERRVPHLDTEPPRSRSATCLSHEVPKEKQQPTTPHPYLKNPSKKLYSIASAAQQPLQASTRLPRLETVQSTHGGDLPPDSTTLVSERVEREGTGVTSTWHHTTCTLVKEFDPHLVPGEREETKERPVRENSAVSTASAPLPSNVDEEEPPNSSGGFHCSTLGDSQRREGCSVSSGALVSDEKTEEGSVEDDEPRTDAEVPPHPSALCNNAPDDRRPLQRDVLPCTKDETTGEQKGLESAAKCTNAALETTHFPPHQMEQEKEIQVVDHSSSDTSARTEEKDPQASQSVFSSSSTPLFNAFGSAPREESQSELQQADEIGSAAPLASSFAEEIQSTTAVSQPTLVRDVEEGIRMINGEYMDGTSPPKTDLYYGYYPEGEEDVSTTSLAGEFAPPPPSLQLRNLPLPSREAGSEHHHRDHSEDQLQPNGYGPVQRLTDHFDQGDAVIAAVSLPAVASTSSALMPIRPSSLAVLTEDPEVSPNTCEDVEEDDAAALPRSSLGEEDESPRQCRRPSSLIPDGERIRVTVTATRSTASLTEDGVAASEGEMERDEEFEPRSTEEPGVPVRECFSEVEGTVNRTEERNIWMEEGGATGGLNAGIRLLTPEWKQKDFQIRSELEGEHHNAINGTLEADTSSLPHPADDTRTGEGVNPAVCSLEEMNASSSPVEKAFEEVWAKAEDGASAGSSPATIREREPQTPDQASGGQTRCDPSVAAPPTTGNCTSEMHRSVRSETNDVKATAAVTEDGQEEMGRRSTDATSQEADTPPDTLPLPWPPRKPSVSAPRSPPQPATDERSDHHDNANEERNGCFLQGRSATRYSVVVHDAEGRGEAVVEDLPLERVVGIDPTLSPRVVDAVLCAALLKQQQGLIQ